ncbi:MAG: sporulation protein YqfD [Eubacteriales bacterium]
MGKLSRFLFGGYMLTVPESTLTDVMNILVCSGIPFGKVREGDGFYSLYLTKSGFAQYKIARGERNFGEKAEEIGFFSVIKRYRLRFGMFIGAFLFVIVVSFSSFFVWDINISGNENITSEKIEEYLAAYGFRLGAFIPRLDTEDICRRIMLENGNISFMTINMRGTVAEVKIHERESDEGKVADSTPSNLISKYDAQIERLEITGGVAEVKYLQIVKKGDLLVSGIIDSNALGYRLVRARGKVFGKVTLVYTSEIPFEYTENVPTGEQTEKKSIKIFSKIISISKNNSIPYEKYDTIINNKKLYLFGNVELPLFIMTEKYTEYTERTVTLTRDEAYRKALAEIKKQSEKELSEAEILSRETVLTEGEDFLRLTVYVECILDISEEKQIETAGR